jgi:trigger factor
VEVTVPYEEMKPKFDEAYVTYRKKIQLEGFRKGKVPIDLIKKVFGVKIENEVAEQSVSDFLETAVKEKNIKIYDISKLESVTYERNKGLQFKALVKIQPEVEVGKYADLEIEKEIYQVTDDDIKEIIDNLREQQATMTNIDGAAQRNHYIVADVQQIDSTGVPIVGHKYENRYFQLGGDQADDEFVEQLLGIKPGETRRIILPAQHPDPEKKEQQLDYFAVTIKEVKEKKLPEIDDELAKDVGDYETLQQLKENIQGNLEKQAEENTRQSLSNRIMDEVIKSNPIELPDFIIENFLNAFIENIKKENKEKVDEQELRDKYRADAIWNLKWLMIKDKISELENIKVDDGEINKYIEELAKNSGKNATLVRSHYRDKKKREQVMHRIEEGKVIDLLLSRAKIIDKIVTYKDRQKAQELIV